ncbi:MAG: DUF1080 domain-containing protein [Phycisphaera sp.]|nr:DUF1080 domain-containing protein [Phycisphaera sp.]
MTLCTVAALLVAAGSFGLSTRAQAADDDGFVSLFNGKDLDNFEQKGGVAKYSIEGDAIVGQSVPNTPNSFLCTKKIYTDFILEYEFKAVDLNSGVQIRSNAHDKEVTEAGKKIAAGRVHGYQIEIDADKLNRMWVGGIYDEGRRGWLFPGAKGGDAAAVTEQGKKLYKVGDWNKIRVEAKGDSIKTWLNGEPRAEITDDLTPSGFIGLQVHGVGKKTEPEFVRWRNLRIKELSK